VDKHRGDDVCCCGNKSFSYNFSYNGMKMDNIQETFCYKCCDEKFMLGNLKVENEKFTLDIGKRKISYKGKIYLKAGANAYWGIGFPGYMKNYLCGDYSINYIHNDNDGYVDLCIDVELKENVPKQAHYCGIYIVSEMNIYHHKFTFAI
jgi:hypothetical protein